MPTRYKIKIPKTMHSKREKYYKLIILLFMLIVVFCLGVLFIWHEYGLVDEKEKLAKSDEALRYYKEMNSKLLESIDLFQAYQKIILSNPPDVEMSIRNLELKLNSVTRAYNNIETKIAKLENREKEVNHLNLIELRMPKVTYLGNESDVCLVKGKVVDISGLPRAGVGVGIKNLHTGVTNEKGEYVVKDVPKGRYFIQAASEKEESIKKNVFISKSIETISAIIFPAPVREMFFCKAINKLTDSSKNPEWVIIDRSDEFEQNVGKVVCFTQIAGARRNTNVIHRWFWNDRLQSEVSLEVRSLNWRTYSEKTIGKTGHWRVEVTREGDNTILASRTFYVR